MSLSTKISLAARTITPYVFLYCPNFSLITRRPSSIIPTMSKPTHSLFSSSYYSIITPTLSFVSHSFPSLPTPFITIRHQSSLSSAVWNPQRVENFFKLLFDTSYLHTPGDGLHWLVQFGGVEDIQFDTEQALFDFYIKALATVVGSEAEAMNKIYLVAVGTISLGFGVEIDENTKNKLIETLRMQNIYIDVIADRYYGTRGKDPNIQSTPRFIPVNWHRRLDNIFSYHHLSEKTLLWKSNRWLICTREPDGGFTDRSEILDFYFNLLADIFGSEREAKKRIYMIWLKLPFGFAAKFDKKTANKLKGLPDVLKVLPDYSIDGNTSDDVAIISPPSHGTVFSNYLLSKEFDSEDCVSMEDHVGLSCKRLDSKHWFIRMENPGGECASIQQRIDTYIQTLAIAIGSEEAEKKIYRVECEGSIFGFGAEIEVETSNKLKGMPGVLAVHPDCIFGKSSRIQSGIRFTPLNRNHRLDDIYSYHHFSKFNTQWNSDHWLVHIRQPDCEIGSEQTVNFCIQLFAKVVGSDKDAKERIYIVWCKSPFGFGAEMDEKTLNKLKDLPDVLMVLPDYAFDIKSKDRGALVISSSSCLKSDSLYTYRRFSDIDTTSSEEEEEEEVDIQWWI